MARKRKNTLGTVEEEREALAQQRVALEDLRRELGERIAAVKEREDELRSALAEARNGATPTVRLPPVATADPGADARLAARARELDARDRELREREQRVAALAAAAAARDPDEDTGEHAAELERREQALARHEETVQLGLAEREKELDERALQLEERARALAETPAAMDAARLATIEARLAEVRAAEAAFVRTREELAARSEAVAARERLAAEKERELDEREDGWGGGPELQELESRLRRLETQRQAASGPGFSGGFRRLEQEGTRPRV